MEDYLTLILVILIVLAFVCSRLLHDFAERRGLVSGIEYAIVGWLIGPAAPWVLLRPNAPWAGLITEEGLQSLDLLISLLLGLLGFMVGLHAREALRRFEHFLAGSFAALLVAGCVGLAVLGLVQWVDVSYLAVENPLIEHAVYADDTRIYELWAAGDALWLALTLGAAAAIASSSAINVTVQRWRAEGEPVILLRDLAVAGQFFAILLFGIALSGDRAVDTADSADSYGDLVLWAVSIGATGALTGLLFMLFIGGDTEDDGFRLYLASIGVVIFAAGVGAALGVSPLFVNMIAGLVVAATSVHGDRLRDNLDHLRRPVGIMIMVFAGIMWRPVEGWMWVIPAVYLGLRVSTRLWASRWAVSTFVHGVELRRVGGGLIGQGALAGAVALSYAQGHPDRGPIVLSAVLLPMLVTDWFTVENLRRVLANAGAIRPRAQVELEAEPEAASEQADEPAQSEEPAAAAKEAAAQPEAEPQSAEAEPAPEPEPEAPPTSADAAPEPEPEPEPEAEAESSPEPAEAEPEPAAEAQAEPSAKPATPKFVAPARPPGKPEESK